MNKISAAAFAAAISAFAGSAQAEPLTFNAALARAADTPSLQGRAASVRAAQSAAIAADQLPDPTLDVGLQDFPVTGPTPGSLVGDNFTMERIGVSQQFINPAKRHARAARARADIGLAQADVGVEARNVRLQTALAWMDVYYGEKRLAILELLDKSLDDLQSTVSARLASGSARPSQALEPTQLRAQVADRRSGVVAEIAKARAMLGRWTGEGQADVAGAPPSTDIDRGKLMTGIANLPTLRAMDAQTQAADANTRLARADKNPDWTVNASYGRRQRDYGDLVSVGVTIDLPLFSKHRQDPKIAARGLEAERARYDRQAAEREVLANLEADLADHMMHHQRLENAHTSLVPLAQKRAALDRDSYAAGKTDLGTALLSTLAVAEAEIDALDREAEVARDAIRINLTYGEDNQ